MFSGLVTYGTTGPPGQVPELAAEAGFDGMILGVYDVSNPTEIDDAVALARSFPNLVKAVCLGNEGLLFQNYDLDLLEGAFSQVRRALPGVPLTTSEPIFAWGNPRLLDLTDFCFPIIHPWIHGIFKHDPHAAALWTIQAAQRLRILADRPVLVKETGFPGDATAYPEALQAEFWRVLLREYRAAMVGVEIAVFEAFDNPHRLHYAAQKLWDCHWGIYRGDRTPKPAVEAIRQAESCRGAVGSTSVNVDGRVSVVITARDRPEYLERAIQSTLEQGPALAELILINDNSSVPEVDGVCTRYARLAGVRYRHLHGPGSSGSARNAGLGMVSSPYVCFLDDDDLFYPHKLTAQAALLETNPDIGFVSTGAWVIDEQGTRLRLLGVPEFFPGASLANMVAYCQLAHSSVMLRTELVREAGGYREHYRGEDWELWCRLLSRGVQAGRVDQALTGYRRHGSNISNTGYVRAARRAVMREYGGAAPRVLLAPLLHDPASGCVINAALAVVHGLHDDALDFLGGGHSRAERIIRHVCLRELGHYDRAREEIEGWARELGADEMVLNRLRLHERRRSEQPGIRTYEDGVGSLLLFLEKRLLARDALRYSIDSRYEPDLRLYFQSNPEGLDVEDADIDAADQLFFQRVQIVTSC